MTEIHPPTRRFKLVLLCAGPLAASIVWMLIPSVNSLPGAGMPARLSLSVAIWMAIWWITEPVSLEKTAALPLVVFPLMSVRPLMDILKSYAHPLIFLFLGGFIISIALQKWGLDRRFAVGVIRIFGARRTALVAGIMAATAGLSMWISNTATTIMMLPIALSIIAANQNDPIFSRCVLLALAYSASIGGIATIIGTPPNAFVASYIQDSLGIDVGFIEWMTIGLPLAVIFLVLCWVYLVYVAFPIHLDTTGSNSANITRRVDPALKFAEWLTCGVFVVVATGWITRRWLVGLEFDGFKPFAGLTDSWLAMGGALMLLLLPSRSHQTPRLLEVQDLAQVPWGTLLLFGGGLALSSTIKETGADQLIGAWMSALPVISPIIVLGLIITFVVFMTELTSNIATTATLVPLLTASAQNFGLETTTVIVATAFAASCAFMLPVATPPNAIVYGSGRVTSRQMATTGFGLNLLGIILITYVMHAWFGGFASN